jgi:signal transduction histidine kinase
MASKEAITRSQKLQPNADGFQAKDVNYKTKPGGPSVIDMRNHSHYNQPSRMQDPTLIINAVIEHGTFKEEFVRPERLASMGRLCANLAHELNNPLDGVLRYMRLLLDQMSEDDSRRIYVESARDGLVRMADMVRGLLDFARRSTSVVSPIDIPQSIRRILSSFGEQISAQNIKVEAEFDENIPVILNIDVEQIFMNIIKNAIQAMPDGGTLSVKAKMLSAELVEVRFSDTGSGIPDEIRKAIFEPFFTTKDIGQGVGLGLSISREIAKSYNGSIDVESRLGEGTTFIIRLPISDSGLTIKDL